MVDLKTDDKSDGLAFKVAKSNQVDEPAAVPELNVPAGNFDVEGFKSQLGNAVDSLRQAHVAPEELDFDTAQMLGAAFRQGNIVASAISSKSLAEQLFPTEGSKELEGEELFDRLKKDGLTAHVDNFMDVFTEAQYDARKADIALELEDRRMLEASGFSGVAASLAAGVLDLPTLVPLGRAVQLTKMATTAGRTAAEVGLASGISAIATEAVFQNTQQLRTAEESALAVGSATVLGAALGFSVHKAFGNKLGDELTERMDALRKEAATGFVGARSAGAKAIDFAEQLRARGLDGDSRVFSAYAFDLLEGMGKLPGFVGANLRNPRMELENGMTAAERRFIGQMTHNPSISVKQAEAAKLDGDGASVGFEAPVNVAGKAAEFQGSFVDTVYEAEKLWKQNKANYGSFDDFGDQVAFAMVSNDESADPVIRQAAKFFRDGVFEPIRETHVANGNFEEAMSPRNARSYFPLVHDAEAVRANKEAWLDHHEAAFLRELEEDYRQASVEKGARQSDKADIKIRAKNAAAGETKIVADEHDENIRAIGETRKAEVAKHEAQLKEDRQALADARRDDLAAIKAKFDDQARELAVSRDMMLSGDVDAKERNRIKVSYERDKSALAKRRLREEKAAEKAFDKASRKVEVEAARRKKDISGKFDDQEAKARTARDKAIADVEAKKAAEFGTAKQLDINGGLSVLRFNTRAAREAEAAKRAQAMYDAVTGNARFTADHDISLGAAGYSKFRSNPAWHADLIARKWVKTNIFDIAEHYTRTAGVDAAVGSVFKRTVLIDGDTPGTKASKVIGDIRLKDVRASIEREYKDALSSAKTPDEEVALKNKAQRALENVDMLLRFAHGQPFNDGTSQSFAHAAELAGAFNFLRLMGGTVASSLGDPMNIVIANGWGRTMKYGVLPMLKNFRDTIRNMDADQVRLARLAHANTELTMNSTVMALAEMGNPFAKATPLVTFARNASKVFSKYTGITYWNHLWKQVAFNTTTARIVENARTGWGGLSKAERAMMLNLGLNEASLARIGASFEGQAGSKWVAGTDLPIARFDEWADKEAGSLLRAAANQQSYSQVVTPHWADRLAFSESPYGKLVLQFRNFMIANQMRVIGRNVQLAAIDEAGGKRASVATALFGLAMMGAVVDATKHMLGNTTISGGSLDSENSSFDRVLREWEKTPGTALYNALDRTGIFGVVFEASNMAEKLGLPNIRGGMSMAAGDDTGGRRESARFSNRHWSEATLGPTVGLLGDVVSVGGVLTGMADSYISSGEAPNFNRSDFRKAKRLMPMQNAPIIQQFINEGERYMGNVFDWPDPK